MTMDFLVPGGRPSVVVLPVQLASLHRKRLHAFVQADAHVLQQQLSNPHRVLCQGVQVGT